MLSNRLYLHLEKWTSKSALITLFVLAHLVLLVMMTYTFPRINAQLGTEAFDLRPFGYTPTEARSMLLNLDDATVDIYLFPQLFLLDIFYPLLLALLLSTLIIRLSKLIELQNPLLSSFLFLVPFGAMFADYIENILIARMITGPDRVSDSIIEFASFFTLSKGLLTTLSWIVILVLFIVWIRKRKTTS